MILRLLGLKTMEPMARKQKRTKTHDTLFLLKVTRGVAACGRTESHQHLILTLSDKK